MIRVFFRSHVSLNKCCPLTLPWSSRIPLPESALHQPHSTRTLESFMQALNPATVGAQCGADRESATPSPRADDSPLQQARSAPHSWRLDDAALKRTTPHSIVLLSPALRDTRSWRLFTSRELQWDQPFFTTCVFTLFFSVAWRGGKEVNQQTYLSDRLYASIIVAIIRSSQSSPVQCFLLVTVVASLDWPKESGLPSAGSPDVILCGWLGSKHLLTN